MNNVKMLARKKYKKPAVVRYGSLASIVKKHKTNQELGSSFAGSKP